MHKAIFTFFNLSLFFIKCSLLKTVLCSVLHCFFNEIESFYFFFLKIPFKARSSNYQVLCRLQFYLKKKQPFNLKIYIIFSFFFSKSFVYFIFMEYDYYLDMCNFLYQNILNYVYHMQLFEEIVDLALWTCKFYEHANLLFF